MSSNIGSSDRGSQFTDLKTAYPSTVTRRPKGPLFIIGYPRSGTTLLKAILGSHPEIRLCHEPELIGGFRSAGLDLLSSLSRAERARLLEQLKTINACRKHLSTLTPETLARFVEEGRELSFKEAYELLLPRPEGAAVWGEKSLNNVFRIREIKSLYPEAVIVHIVRDPRSALLSYYRKRFTQSVDRAPVFGRRAIRFFIYRALQWCTWVAAVEKARNADGVDIIQIRYEDLVTKPESETRRVTDALGLEFDRNMLDAARREKDPALKRNEDAHRRLLDPVDSSRARTGKELPQWACFIIERYAGQTLERLGYTLNSSTVGALERLRVKAELSLSERGFRAKLRRMVEARLGERNAYLVP
jgi:hypothetical protein